MLPIIGEMQGARFESCSLTENYLYLKVAARGVHLQRMGVHQEVLLGPGLALDFLCHLSDGQSGFHLPHPLYQETAM